jgi:hypothetical protein
MMHERDQTMAARRGSGFLRQHPERQPIDYDGNIRRSVEQTLERVRALIRINTWKRIT